MTAIYLKHPKHGAKVAISEQEAQQDEQCGWSRFDVDDPDGAEPANALEPRRRRRQTETAPEEEK